MSTTLPGEQVNVGNGAAGCGEKVFAKAVAALEKASERDSQCGRLTEPVMSGTSGGWCLQHTCVFAKTRTASEKQNLPTLNNLGIVDSILTIISPEA